MASLPDDLPANVVAALERGQPIEAIKLLREATGLGLKEAKDALDHHLRDKSVNVPVAAKSRPMPPAVAEALKKGDKIEAIRLLREKGGTGLQEMLEGFQQTHRSPGSGLSPGEVPRTKMGGWIIALLLVAAALGYYVLGR